MKKLSINSVGMYAKARSRELGWFVGGVAVALALSATAQLANAPGVQPPCDLNNAATQAMNNKIQMVGMTSTDPGKYFNAGSPDSCLGDLSLANLDLSNLIPDPIGLLSIGLDSLIDALKKAAIAAACKAVRNSVGDVIGKYNSAIGSINGTLDIRGQTNQLIDSTIGDASRKALDGQAMNWKTPTPTRVTSGVQAPNLPVILPPAAAPAAAPATTPAAPAGNSGAPSGLGGAVFR